LDEEYPWMSIVRYLVKKIQKEYGENKWSIQTTFKRKKYL
jgi:hypothetical protein